jgi:hypothetical protein
MISLAGSQPEEYQSILTQFIHVDHCLFHCTMVRTFFQCLHLIVYPTKAFCAWLHFIFQDYNASFCPWNLDRIYVRHEQLQGVCPRSCAFYWKSGSSRGILQDHWFVTVTLYFTLFQWLDHHPYWTVGFLLPKTNSCADCKVLPLPSKMLS